MLTVILTAALFFATGSAIIASIVATYFHSERNAWRRSALRIGQRRLHDQADISKAHAVARDLAKRKLTYPTYDGPAE